MSANLLGLGENPFAAGHDPRLIHSTPLRAEILSRFRQALGTGEPFIVITGETGIGKTSVVSEALADPRTWAAFITNPSLTRAELLEEICLRFGVDVAEQGSKPQRLARLERHLVEIREAGDVPALVIDEAHDLSVELLEELRLLSNLELGGKPLLPIVLVGLPALEARLGEAGLEQLRQRIAVHARLEPLDAAETERYVHHRVQVAGSDGAERFPSETCLEIHRVTRGIPRAINALAGRALVAASRESERVVTPAHVEASATDTWLHNVASGAPRATSDTPPPPPRKARKPATPKPSESPAPEVAELAPPPTPAPSGPQPIGSPPATESDVRAWVSRFVDPDQPVIIGVRAMESHGAFAGYADPDWEEAADDPSLPAVPGAPGPRRAAPRSLLRARRGAVSPWLTGVAVVVVAGALAVVLVPRLRGVAATSGAAPQATVASRESPAGPTPQTVAQKTAPAVAAPVDTVPAKPKRRVGLEVATYLDPYRASAESARLAEITGLSARVMESPEGVEVYRVVLGSFGSRRRAERAADDLIARGLVEQATVVTLGKASATP